MSLPRHASVTATGIIYKLCFVFQIPQNGTVENWRRAQESSEWTASGFGLYSLIFFRDPLQRHWLSSPVILGSWQFNDISFSLSGGPTLTCCWPPLPYTPSPNPLSTLCHQDCQPNHSGFLHWHSPPCLPNWRWQCEILLKHLFCEGKEMHPSFAPPVCKDVGGPQHTIGFLQNPHWKSYLSTLILNSVFKFNVERGFKIICFFLLSFCTMFVHVRSSLDLTQSASRGKHKQKSHLTSLWGFNITGSQEPGLLEDRFPPLPNWSPSC